MRITEGQLRRIIREEILREAAMTPWEARDHDIRFEMRKWQDKVKIVALKEGDEVGYIAADLIPHEGSRVWEVSLSSADVDGLGPLLYDLMIDAVSPDPLTPDRHTVSASAKRVWDYYLNDRGDIESQQLDDLKNTLTPTYDDNHAQHSSKRWDGDSWPESSLSKAYKRRRGRTPTLSALDMLDILEIS